jgi:PEP-CTERM motif
VLDFQDWPATIAINHLVIDFTPDAPPVPEPASLTLLGSGLLGLCVARLRSRASKKPTHTHLQVDAA